MTTDHRHTVVSHISVYFVLPSGYCHTVASIIDVYFMLHTGYCNTVAMLISVYHFLLPTGLPPHGRIAHRCLIIAANLLLLQSDVTHKYFSYFFPANWLLPHYCDAHRYFLDFSWQLATTTLLQCP